MSTDPSLNPAPPHTGTADIFFVPAPVRVVTEMLKIADVNAGDLVMDLGSGDGQILIAAAKEHGSRGVGVEIDPALVAQSRAAADAAGVSGLLEFKVEDFFETDLRPASVLMLYLLDSINVRLRPKILHECRPGTRVVTYSFEMGEWQCDAHVPIAANGVSLWIVPANISGEWMAAKEGGVALRLEQCFQELAGTVLLEGISYPVITGRVRGHEFMLAIERDGTSVTMTGRAEDDRMNLVIHQGECPDLEAFAVRTPASAAPL
jgi:SAM-dependent methyltransferase